MDPRRTDYDEVSDSEGTSAASTSKGERSYRTHTSGEIDYDDKFDSSASSASTSIRDHYLRASMLVEQHN